MLRNKYGKSTDLINHFIITEHKELSCGTVVKYKYDKVSIFKIILYNLINKLKWQK
jgi:hypothetical protein